MHSVEWHGTSGHLIHNVPISHSINCVLLHLNGILKYGMLEFANVPQTHRP